MDLKLKSSKLTTESAEFKRFYRMAVRRVASKNCPDYSTKVYSSTTFISHTVSITNMDEHGTVTFSVSFEDHKLCMLKMGDHVITYNSRGEVSTSESTYKTKLYQYHDAYSRSYLNLTADDRTHICINYKLNDGKRYLRKKRTYDRSYLRQPTNGEVITYGVFGNVTSRHYFINGKKYNYRDNIKSGKDKLMISLVNDQMQWLPDE